MGRKLFNVDIAGDLARQLGPLLERMTLTTSTPGDEIPGALSAGSDPVLRDYRCRGFVDSYKDRDIDGTIVHRGDRKITILGDSIQDGIVPRPGDKITDRDGRTYKIVPGGVESDPDRATYVCQARGKPGRP